MTQNPALEPAMTDTIRRAMPDRTIIEAPTCEAALTAGQMAEEVRDGLEELNTRLDEHIETASANLASYKARIEALEAKPPTRSGGLLYVWKGTEELRWAVLSIAAPVLIAALQDIGNVTDYRTWIIGIGAAIVRPLGGRLLALLAKRQMPAAPAPHGERT